MKIGIIGAGAWGTALAATAARTENEIILWARETEVAKAINNIQENNVFLPNFKLDSKIRATNEISDAASSEILFLVTPTQHLRTMCLEILPLLKKEKIVVICAKGIEQKTGKLPSEIIDEVLTDIEVAVLSGPTFAIEVAKGVPTAVTLATKNRETGQKIINSIGTKTFRPYFSDDIIGCQIGGAVKNVLAIACGIVEGRKLGDNARAALVTRGLAEVMRFAKAMGGKPETIMGLSGLGDLILTANSMQSRNFSLGVELGKGNTLSNVLEKRVSVAEGVYTASAVCTKAKELNIEMPISEAVFAIINNQANIDDIVSKLLERPFKSE